MQFRGKSDSKKKSCGIFTNIAPLYSRPLWYKLSDSITVEYFFYASKVGFSGIKTIDLNESVYENNNGKLKWYSLKNVFLKGVLVFQRGLISRCLKTNYDAYILYGEMHSLSNWIAALICRLRNKPLLFWGHGLYGNEKNLKKIIRHLYYKLADYHLVYGQRSRNLMIESGFKPGRIFVVYNSLDFYNHKKLFENYVKEDFITLRKRIFPERDSLPVVIFIGRLIKEKRIEYLLNALEMCRKRGNNYNCLIIGEGDEKDKLHQLSISLGLNESVVLYGPSYSEETNAMLIMLSECCVSPGNIGLAAIHCLSLGTPVITHGNMSNQGPEAEAIIHNETGLFFEENNVESLSAALDDMILNKKKSWMGKNCLKQIQDFWNPDNQADAFDIAVNTAILNHNAR